MARGFRRKKGKIGEKTETIKELFVKYLGTRFNDLVSHQRQLNRNNDIINSWFRMRIMKSKQKEDNTRERAS